jgi:hypothetical protein
MGILELSSRRLNIHSSITDGTLDQLLVALDAYPHAQESRSMLTFMAPGPISFLESASRSQVGTEELVETLARSLAVFKMLVVLGLVKWRHGSVDFEAVNELFQLAAEAEFAMVEDMANDLAKVPSMVAGMRCRVWRDLTSDVWRITHAGGVYPGKYENKAKALEAAARLDFIVENENEDEDAGHPQKDT